MGRMKEAALSSESYPDSPGWKESTTSRLAAQNIAADAKIIRARVLAAIKERPRTADEVADALGIDILTARPRCSELRMEQKIRPYRDARGKQVRRPNASGRAAIVWQAVPEDNF